MTNVTKFKLRNTVGAPAWVLVLPNAALLDEFNALIDEHEGSVRFNFISDEISRREDAGILTDDDWTEKPQQEPA